MKLRETALMSAKKVLTYESKYARLNLVTGNLVTLTNIGCI